MSLFTDAIASETPRGSPIDHFKKRQDAAKEKSAAAKVVAENPAKDKFGSKPNKLGGTPG